MTTDVLETVDSTFDSPLLFRLAQDAAKRAAEPFADDAIAAIILAYQLATRSPAAHR